MKILLLIFFTLTCAGLLFGGIRDRWRIYEFPFLAGAAFTCIALTQFYGLVASTNLPTDSYEKAIFMTIICALALWGGYRVHQQPASPISMFWWRLDEHKLLFSAVLLTALGAYFFWAISRLPEEMIARTQWTGLPVAYNFFAKSLSCGFAISLLLWVKNRSTVACVTALCGSLFYLDQIILSGRRSSAIHFCLMILIAFWFHRRKLLPRWIVIGLLLTSAFVLYSIKDYRMIAIRDGGHYASIFRGEVVPTVQKVTDIDFVGNLLDVLGNGASEIRATCFLISAADEANNYDYGLYHWDRTVFNLVPGQLIGQEVKNALRLGQPTDAKDLYGFELSKSTAQTGMTDAFRSFWFFGCIKFFIIGFFMRRLYDRSMAGSFLAQILYMLLIISALHSIPHNTQIILTTFINLAVFILPTFYYCRVREPQSLRMLHRAGWPRSIAQRLV